MMSTVNQDSQDERSLLGALRCLVPFLSPMASLSSNRQLAGSGNGNVVRVRTPALSGAPLLLAIASAQAPTPLLSQTTLSNKTLPSSAPVLPKCSDLTVLACLCPGPARSPCLEGAVLALWPQSPNLSARGPRPGCGSGPLLGLGLHRLAVDRCRVLRSERRCVSLLHRRLSGGRRPASRQKAGPPVAQRVEEGAEALGALVVAEKARVGASLAGDLGRLLPVGSRLRLGARLNLDLAGASELDVSSLEWWAGRPGRLHLDRPRVALDSVLAGLERLELRLLPGADWDPSDACRARPQS